MTSNRQQREHAINLADEFGEMMLSKYKRGQEEHSGNLWEVSSEDILNMALDEVTDLAIYLLTLRDKLDNYDDEPEPERGEKDYYDSEADWYDDPMSDPEYDPWGDY